VNRVQHDAILSRVSTFKVFANFPSLPGCCSDLQRAVNASCPQAFAIKMNASAVASVAESLSLVAEQDDGDYGDLTYILFNATLGVLIIDPTITNIDVLSSSVLGDLLSRKNFVVGQLCTFPISGAYGFLNRLLYYCLLLFALLVRHSTWLCPAALGAAMTYSVGACVHTFALLA